ncbi:pentapeptide repeat-containing protein [Crossiella cryophila]|uniref:Uncharacterized protein YjbI with pentapeptide repeats n=1 Tax=Crossiella cryophila TaxID=43355 RepID=A0A7W7FX10_9PSEU|nr:pentapeptide repeat-containing protein [Crossiella cryophila]MBB4680153.1 uncharacterized protein YjbI with pentapeptide repeats [Crossiella cryophila]
MKASAKTLCLLLPALLATFAGISPAAAGDTKARKDIPSIRPFDMEVNYNCELQGGCRRVQYNGTVSADGGQWVAAGVAGGGCTGGDIEVYQNGRNKDGTRWHGKPVQRADIACRHGSEKVRFFGYDHWDPEDRSVTLELQVCVKIVLGGRYCSDVKSTTVALPEPPPPPTPCPADSTVCDDEQAGMLTRSAAEWNDWRQANPDAEIKLRNVRFLGGKLLDLTGADLRDVDLTGADFVGWARKVNLTGADFRGADLTGAQLNDVDLTKADLRGANVKNANISGATLSGANLTGMDMTGLGIRELSLAGANLTEANFAQVDGTQTDLSGADLTRATFTGSSFLDGNFSKAKLSGADIRETTLFRANLAGADLTGADLLASLLMDADLTGANLTDTRFMVPGQTISAAELDGADLTDVNLAGSRISDEQLSSAKSIAGCRNHPPQCPAGR